MSGRERKPITIRFDKDLFDEAETYRTAEGMQKAEFFEEAVREYIDADRTARIENRTVEMDKKLNSILDALGEEAPTPSEPEEEKEKDSDPETDEDLDYVDIEPLGRTGDWGGYTDQYLSQGPLTISGRQREGKADRMVNYMFLTYDLPLYTESEMKAAIETIVGKADTYNRGVYLSRIEDRLSKLGWVSHPLKDGWCEGKERARSMIEAHWGDIEAAVLGDGDLSDLEDYTIAEYVKDRQKFNDAFQKYDVAEREEIVMALDTLESELDRRR